MVYCRLLKEMGWTESDEEEYVITEDEKKEFQDRCSKQVGHGNLGHLRGPGVILQLVCFCSPLLCIVH